MKKLFTLLLCLTVFSSLTIFNSCKKETDDDSAYVTKGTTINVIQNYDLTISSWQWSYDNLYERWYYQWSCTANSNSLIYAYVMSGAGEQLMPYYTCQSSNAWCKQYDLATNLFQSPPYVEFQYTNYNSRTTKPAYDEYFYIIIVPPSVSMAHPNVDWTNYDEVKATFNLTEQTQ